MLFKELNIIQPILRALDDEGYKEPTPIQEQAIGVILEGKDLIGSAQTGTGKTAAFAVPILQLLHNESPFSKKHKLRALVLSPTRELAIQIKESFTAYSRHLRLKSAVIYGGVSQIPQTRALRSGVDVLIATPGRLLDLCNQKIVDLHEIEHFVLDEADLMLDMGFIDDVKKIISKLPENRQTLMFSATMPKEIVDLSKSILKDPVRIAVDPDTSTVKNTSQYIYFVDKCNKEKLLKYLLEKEDIESALIFTRTKRGADKVEEGLKKAGIRCDAIHGNRTQKARQQILRDFKIRKINVLVATDIAARGIDVSDLSHVINYDMPDVPETYIHRIGRTGRAGKSGVAISFCDREGIGCLRDIQNLIGIKIPIVTDQPYAADISALTAAKNQSFKRYGSSNGFHQRNHGGKNTKHDFPKKNHKNRFYNGKVKSKKIQKQR
jgi:ATP-dependent RNA helicase RhlE